MGKTELIISLAEVQRSKAQAAFLPPGDKVGSFEENLSRCGGPFAGLSQPETSQVDCYIGELKKGKIYQGASWRGGECKSCKRRKCQMSSRVGIPAPGSLKSSEILSSALRIWKGDDLGSVVHRPIRRRTAAVTP